MRKLLHTIYDCLISPLVEPRSSEKLKLIRERWDTLDEKLKLPQQTAGVCNNACGAIHSIMEKCNFDCTSCYLSDIAKHTMPLPFDAIKEQLDTLRHHLGPAGKAQITSGEVTLLSKDELGRIVAYIAYGGFAPGYRRYCFMP